MDQPRSSGRDSRNVRTAVARASGYDFLSLRPALYAAGTGEVRFRNFVYRALP